jgi:hypothetical protein
VVPRRGLVTFMQLSEQFTIGQDMNLSEFASVFFSQSREGLFNLLLGPPIVRKVEIDK